MQLDLPFTQAAAPTELVEFVRVRKARRYILRVRPDGTLRVTIPRGGSRAQAAAFMARHLEWVVRERNRVHREQTPARWTDGSLIPLRGEAARVSVSASAGRWVATLDGRGVEIRDPANARPELEWLLRQIAKEELLPRLAELAAVHGLQVTRVTIRNQRSRWGSCSRGGAIALNFRLLQMPPAIADYVMIHELMHLRQQNHGQKFWALVERAYPGYREAERWLRRAGRSLF